MEERLLISVIIPVYNVEKYLTQCLESVQNQTLQNLEIICVDDGSSDNSRDLLKKKAAQDSRIRLCFHEHNSGVFMARKTGVAMAKGEYILFLDSDDYLELTACEKLYQKITAENVDMLHFPSRVVKCGNGNDVQQKNVEQLIRPYGKKLIGENVFSVGFAQKKVWGTLWNKLYRAHICKKAFSELEDGYFAIGEDVYTFCVISYFTQSYLGWDTEPLHNYRFGIGISTAATVDLGRFERYCTQAKSINAMKAFCKTHGVYGTAKEMLDECFALWLDGCCRAWKNELSKELAAPGWEIMCKYWGSEAVIGNIARNYFEHRREIAQRMACQPRLSMAEREIKTVGFYYHRMYAGGVERVISILAPMIQKMGFKIVVFTDESPTQQDFAMPEGIIREVIFSNVETDWKNVDQRFASITEVVKKHGIDIVLYNAWMSNLLLWDMLHLKGLGVPVVVHAHGVFSCTITEFGELFSELPRVMALADGVVTLSDVDKRFWDNFSDNVHFIPNPASESLNRAKPGAWEHKTVIWVGRSGPEKQPEKVFDIMERVVSELPDVKLLVLGNFEDPKWQKLITNKHLEANVTLCGMVNNVSDYLEKASIFVCTSKFEGFPMSLVEAQAHSLPTVMFRIPHLTMAKDGCGVVSVDMNDVQGAAVEVIRLLKNREAWEQNSAQAYRSFTWLRDYDLQGAWRAVLTGVVPESTRNAQTVNMINTLIEQYELGLQKQEAQNAIIWFLRKVIGGIECCMESGIKYTVRLAFRKIKVRFGLEK